MTAPNDLNDRIAKAKGWTWIAREPVIETGWGRLDLRQLSPDVGEWRDPRGQVDFRPDFTGTLKGLAGLMQELQSRRKPMSQWAWYWNERKQRFVMRYAWFRRRLFRRQIHATFYSPKDRPGDCVGEAWLSVFEKEERRAKND